MKRLALFLDGTWNTVESNTNVSQLCALTADVDGAIQQLRYYDTGPGTRQFEKLRGGALGHGLGTNVVEAYSWLRDNYVDGDEVFIFGFSRGAFTARSLAGFIAKSGLLLPSAELQPHDLFHRYQLSAEKRPIYELEYAKITAAPLNDEELALLAASRRIKIKMIAVWDTVGALGVPFGNIPGLSRRQYQFHNTRLSTLFEHAYHAIAIDEHRAAFEPTLWTRFTPKTPDVVLPSAVPHVEQRWFIGDHGNVGGGSPGRLSDIPLAWLQQKAVAAGLKMATVSKPQPRSELQPIFDGFASFMYGIYRWLKINRRFHRTIQVPVIEKTAGFVETVNETIDASVFARMRHHGGYRPIPIMRWAATQQVDPLTITTSVSARTGKTV